MGAAVTTDTCDAQLKRLKVLKGLPEEIVEYFSALKDVPDEVFTKAVSHALKTRHWFPTPAELRADCDAVAVVTLPVLEPKVEALVGGGRVVTIENPLGGKSLTLHITREWRLDCDGCADTGWAPHKCPETQCGRRFEHSAHEWVDRCACIAWNPTIRRRKESTAKYSQSPEKVHS